jgi:translation initiation factor eIF-2B subunit epsilon
MDLHLSDSGSISSSEDDGETSEDEGDTHEQAQSGSVAIVTSIAEVEFRHEVNQSLERAFTEGHSVDNAAVELKTLRMASNVPLRWVREAVVRAIVERIRIVDSGVVAQRKETATVIGRWGGLIDKIGGVNAVETITVLQVMCFPYVTCSLTETPPSRLVVRHLSDCLCSAKFLMHCIRTTWLRRMTFESGTLCYLPRASV